MSVGYIGSTIPARTVRVSGSTLFQVAMMQTGDALNWVSIAKLNGLIDPWIGVQQDILIPPVLPAPPLSGILDSVSSGLATAVPLVLLPTSAPRALIQATAPVTPPPTPPATSGPSLDFSQAGNSQYLPLT